MRARIKQFMERMDNKKNKTGCEVLRLGNLGRMGVLWTLWLIYSHICLLYVRLRLWLHHKDLSSRYCGFPSPSSPHLKPACIVTGASSGIGRATALALALQGFHVILAGRSLDRLQLVQAEIKASVPGLSCQVLELDLCKIPSILSFSKIIQELFEGDDPPGTFQLLVNNAGILAASQRWTEDGFDVMMATNYLGPFILTHQLLPLLQESAPYARIVNVVSFTHRSVQCSKIVGSQLVHGTLRKPVGRDWYHLAHIYEISKLYLIFFSYELHRRYFENLEPNSRVSIIAADPGAVSTNILREVPSWLAHLSSVVLGLLGLLQSPRAGALSVVAAAMAPWDVSGKYCFGSQGLYCKSSSISYNEMLAQRLWEASKSINKDTLRRHK